MIPLNKTLAGTGLMLLGFASLMDLRPWLALLFLTAAGTLFLSAIRGILRKS